MNNQNKHGLCERFEGILTVIYLFGNSILLSQLQTLCVKLGIEKSQDSVSRAVRRLRQADILDQRRAFSGGALILAKKYVLRYFFGTDSQQCATPKRYSERSDISRARRLGWLISEIDRNQICSLPDLQQLLRYSTVFCRDFSDYYHRNRMLLESAGCNTYRAEVELVDTRAEQRFKPGSRVSYGPPLITLESLSRKGIYVADICPENRVVTMVIFPVRAARRNRILELSAEAAWWARSSLECRTKMIIETLDARQARAIRAALTELVGQDGVPYVQEKVRREGLEKYLKFEIHDGDFIHRWSGGKEGVYF